MSLAKKTLIYTLGRILPQAIGFILLPVYTKVLSTEEYGLVESMFIFSTVLTIFFSLATERSMFRLYYDYKTEEERKKFVGNIAIAITLISIAVLLLLFSFSTTISSVYRSIPFNPYFIYAILTSFCMSYGFIPLTIYQVQEKPLLFLYVSVGSFIFSTGFILFYILIAEEGALGFVKGRFVGSILVLPIYLGIIYKESILRFDTKILRNIFSFSLPMVPTLLSTWVISMSNRIFIEQYFSLDDVGVFSLAFKVSSIGTIVLGGVFTAFNPMFYRLANHEEQERSKKRLTKMVGFLSFGILTTCFIITFLSKELFLIFFEPSYIEALDIFPILMLSVLFLQFGGLYNLMIYQNKKPGLISVISIVGALSSILFNFLWVPKFGALGAAIAAALSSLIILILKFVLSKKGYVVLLPIKKLLLCFILSCLFIILDMFLATNIYYSLTFKIVIVLIGIYVYYRFNKSQMSDVLF